jgi:hypothetical protein
LNLKLKIINISYTLAKIFTNFTLNAYLRNSLLRFYENKK